MLSVGPGAPMPSYLPSDYRRRDNIKNGFEELERIVPHAGRLDGEKLSQASSGWTSRSHDSNKQALS